MNSNLALFLEEYERAANRRNFDAVAPFIADDAIFWFTNGSYTGKPEIKRAFEDTWANIRDEKYKLSHIVWLARADDLAVCVYDFMSEGIVSGRRQVYSGHGTNVLTRQNGKWQIIHEHLSKLP